ncbi:hypothetical protein [Polaromonas sp. CG_9.11]|uniref:hypothetical protein n=1 Tax=Polaromonas sp. CG_9.11 TaxID=2787730 RepID=UPI0018CAEB97|nr:hypothetical protein [Polaromonas sp. CG_9.11]MBG6075283.1 hypothetical protein [Polaromonas sp. CG_9.11]
MRDLHYLTRGLAAVSAIALLALAAGCSKPAATNAADTAGAGPAATVQATSALPQANAVSPLGDLTPFRSIAAEVSSFVDKGDLPAARTRIKDLEMAWDSAEAGLKPRAAQDWHALDRAIDQALSALRADIPTQADSHKALTELLRTFVALQGKA